ncbi:MAG TPA: endolytic transglycosylase MltG [Vitreimonas sp.]|uniref:endolytic transglycosylase MltG n=1 Tax=Vitreimonas sp. TaxID=3069702 RepID=UPI002D70BEAF|nr:endolytic transglycosylase MltG [Vitreimonas sp.]HYD89498.1 endolytic transglycosylase MltG [Vitreimonas sp.]
MARFEPRRSGGGFGSFLFWTAVAGGAALLFAAAFFYSAVTRPGPSTQETAFVVERGANGASIASALQEQNLVTDALLFRIANRIYSNGEPLQAGEYSIPAGASVKQIVEMISGGDALQHAITFPEGITIDGVMRILEESDVLTGEMPEAPPEGSILPDTYHVQRGMTRAALLQQMREAHDRAVEEIWARRAENLPISTPEEFVTLASIVERETGIASERPLVAAVFVNRLRRPMRLETDPTIIYGVCKVHPNRCRDGRLVDAQGNRRTIRASEIALDTGYNTYRIDGLPPTPISNPGRAALEATANPADSRALFFVADGTGGHIFAETLDEHNRNVARWRVIERERLAAERAGR